MITIAPLVREAVWKNITHPQRQRLSRQEYNWLGENGSFEGDHVELIEGDIVFMAPMGKPHAVIVSGITRQFVLAFGEGYSVRPQTPFVASDDSEPEPDIAIVVGDDQDYLDEHPSTAVLIIEVADSSLEYDRNVKSGLYARSGVPDYWICNLNDRQLEVRRDPIEMPGQPFGAGYRSLRIYLEDEEVSPLEKPEVKIKVKDLLPRLRTVV